MAAQATSSILSTATLFNDATLSDVTIKQISNGRTLQYYAHKAILSTRSTFFRKAFTGGFKEASSNTMEVHDDDSEHFQVALQFIYCSMPNPSSVIQELTKEKDLDKRAYMAAGLAVIGDKYDIHGLQDSVVRELRTTMTALLGTELAKYSPVLISVIGTYYSSCIQAATPVGQTLVGLVLEPKIYATVTKNPEFEELMRTYTAFGADVAIQSIRKELFVFDFKRVTCTRVYCGATWVVPTAQRPTRCPKCQHNLPSQL